MLHQLTTPGRALINANGTNVVVTRADFGTGVGVPPSEPTGITGSLVVQKNTVFQPIIIDSNTLKYTVFLAANEGPYTFGEIAIYAGATLLGLAKAASLITKALNDEGTYDFYVDLTGDQRFAGTEVNSSAAKNFFPRVISPDLLIPPAFDGNNAYIVYGASGANTAYQAFADPTGRWSFTSKPVVHFTGVVTTISALGMTSADLVGATFAGDVTDLVVQFTDGAQRGYCRAVTLLTDVGAVTWQTTLGALPEVGDGFVILGPRLNDAGPSALPIPSIKGQLLYGRTDGTFALLNPGTNGAVLRANSATASGYEFAVEVDPRLPAAPNGGGVEYALIVGDLVGGWISKQGTTTNGYVLTANDTVPGGLAMEPPPAGGGGALTILNYNTAGIATIASAFAANLYEYIRLGNLVTGLNFDDDYDVVPVGGWFTFKNADLVDDLPLTFTTSTVNVSSGLDFILRAGGTMTAVKVAPNVWDVAGDLIPVGI